MASKRGRTWPLQATASWNELTLVNPLAERAHGLARPLPELAVVIHELLESVLLCLHQSSGAGTRVRKTNTHALGNHTPCPSPPVSSVAQLTHATLGPETVHYSLRDFCSSLTLGTHTQREKRRRPSGQVQKRERTWNPMELRRSYRSRVTVRVSGCSGPSSSTSMPDRASVDLRSRIPRTFFRMGPCDKREDGC